MLTYRQSSVQRFWHESEIHIADYLKKLVPQLVSEWYLLHPDFDKEYSKQRPVVHPSGYKQQTWSAEIVKYTHAIYNMNYDPHHGDLTFPEVRDVFPTACEISRTLGSAVKSIMYSVMEPQSHIPRHYCPENPDALTLRLHVPLIIPEGDVFFECEDEIIDWREIWAFNNELAHSAFNRSDHRRLVLIIDILREFLNVPAATAEEKYDEQRTSYFFRAPFYRLYASESVIRKWQQIPSPLYPKDLTLTHSLDTLAYSDELHAALSAQYPYLEINQSRYPT